MEGLEERGSKETWVGEVKTRKENELRVKKPTDQKCIKGNGGGKRSGNNQVGRVFIEMKKEL